MTGASMKTRDLHIVDATTCDPEAERRRRSAESSAKNRAKKREQKAQEQHDLLPLGDQTVEWFVRSVLVDLRLLGAWDEDDPVAVVRAMCEAVLILGKIMEDAQDSPPRSDF